MFKQLNILNLEKQKILVSACFMWRVANTETSSTIIEKFSLKERVCGNKNLKFHVGSARSNLLKRNIYQGQKFGTQKLWNTVARKAFPSSKLLISRNS